MAGSEELVNIDHPQMRFNHRSRVMGDATTCKQWLDKATVQKSLKRCTFSTLLKLARVLDIRVPVQYSHDSRSFPHPNIEDIAWLIANKVCDMNDELDRAERAPAAPTEAAAADAAQPAATERRRWEAKPYTVQGEDNVFEDDFHWGCTIAKVEAGEDEHVKAYCEAHERQQLTGREWQVLKMYMARRVNMGDADVALPFKRIVRGMARHFVRQASSSGTSTDSDSEKGSENPSPTKSEDISIWFHPSATEAAAAAAAPVAPTEAAAAASSSTTEQKDKKVKKKGKQDKKDDKLYQ